MSGLFSLGAIRSVKDVATNAATMLAGKAASLVGTAGTTSFADVFAAKSSDAEVSVREIRENLATAIESVLTRMGIPIDPALSFVANEEGGVRLEGDHERAAEIEANLQDDANIQALADKLLGSAVGADRRIVLHTISTDL